MKEGVIKVQHYIPCLFQRYRLISEFRAGPYVHVCMFLEDSTLAVCFRFGHVGVVGRTEREKMIIDAQVSCLF